mmetsp:Transcript_7309/g.17830  ORF Transcript_7309/g.17830 Transcript_7309/m.17830 type:complete len:81 (+) Transcript_7309:987-1229(+)
MNRKLVVLCARGDERQSYASCSNPTNQDCLETIHSIFHVELNDKSHFLLKRARFLHLSTSWTNNLLLSFFRDAVIFGEAL